MQQYSNVRNTRDTLSTRVNPHISLVYRQKQGTLMEGFYFSQSTLKRPCMRYSEGKKIMLTTLSSLFLPSHELKTTSRSWVHKTQFMVLGSKQYIRKKV